MRASLVCLFLIAYAGRVADPDAAPAAYECDPITLECQTLESQYAADLAQGLGTCKTDDDCAVIGGQYDDDYCHGYASLGDCKGTPIAANAPGLLDAEQVAQQFFRDCLYSVPGPFDCAPITNATCGADGHCTGTPIGSCFPTPDAALPDATLSDAQ